MAVAADKLLGKWGYGLIYVAAVMAFVSGINATFFSIFRISRSLAEQGVLPKIYEKVLEKGDLRQYSDFGHCSVGGDIYGFSSIVNLSSGAYLVSYLGILPQTGICGGRPVHRKSLFWPDLDLCCLF